MKTEIGGTFKWSTEQVEVYAVAFREGDAVYVKSEGWSEVQSYGGGSALNVHRPLNGYAVNHIEKSGYALGYVSGFDNQYKIVTPKDYEVQEGDKLVWLGETQEYYSRSELTFGKVYDVRKDGDRLIYKTDHTLSILARSEKDRWKFWGVIPKWENVKGEEKMNEKTELVEPIECTGKFEIGDRVKVKVAAFKASEPDIGRAGVVSHIGDFEMNTPYQVDFDEGDFDFFNEAELGLVQRKEVSPERQAFDYLLSQDKTATRRILSEEIAIWAKVHLEHKDYNDLRQAIEIIEKLEKGE